MISGFWKMTCARQALEMEYCLAFPGSRSLEGKRVKELLGNKQTNPMLNSQMTVVQGNKFSIKLFLLFFSAKKVSWSLFVTQSKLNFPSNNF